MPHIERKLSIDRFSGADILNPSSDRPTPHFSPNNLLYWMARPATSAEPVKKVKSKEINPSEVSINDIKVLFDEPDPDETSLAYSFILQGIQKLISKQNPNNGRGPIGYVIGEDITDVFPQLLEADEKEDAEFIDTFYSFLEDFGVNIKLIDETDIEPEGDELDEGILATLESGDMIGVYLKEIGKTPLLTAQEEVVLAKRIKAGNLAAEKLCHNTRLGSKIQTELENAINEGKDAWDHLIKANTRLVVSVAKKYVGRGVDFLDLIQEGNIGLLRAAGKFDHTRGYKFSTYATWWIRQTVTRAIADKGRTIRTPVHMKNQINKLLKMSHQLTQELGRQPRVEELAEAMELPEKRILLLIQLVSEPLDLEEPVGSDEEAVLGELIEDETTPSPTTTATQNILREELDKILDTLPAREARILRLRFGLNGGQSYTLEEVGKMFGITRERIRQIEYRALGRLRHPSHSRLLKGYLH